MPLATCISLLHSSRCYAHFGASMDSRAGYIRP
ncbi:hypothetical protein [Dryocola boscaweniae]